MKPCVRFRRLFAAGFSSFAFSLFISFCCHFVSAWCCGKPLFYLEIVSISGLVSTWIGGLAVHVILQNIHGSFLDDFRAIHT